MLVPVVGYVVTNVKSPMAAPAGVEAYLSGNGYEVTVDWVSSPDNTGALLGYYIYRSCDNQEAVRVNSTMLPTDATRFVDTETLRPGKIYTYYVVACYDNGSAQYLTMNSKSSSVVWGIPQEEQIKYVGSMVGDGSLAMVVSLAALGTAVVALGMTLSARKKNDSEEAEDEA